MLEDTPKEMAEKIRRNTVYAAAKICLQLFNPPYIYAKEIEKLNIMIKEESGTWKELSEIISIIIDDPNASEDCKFIKNVINIRIEQENLVEKFIKDCNTELYHDIENRDLEDIIKYIDRHYTYDSIYILLKHNDYLSKYPKKRELYNEMLLNKTKYTNEEIRENLFGKIKTFDQLLDHIKMLKPIEENNKKYDIEALYETLLHIARRKMQAPQDEQTLFVPCSLCWRPALRRHTPVRHFRCPAHFYREIKGLHYCPGKANGNRLFS